MPLRWPTVKPSTPSWPPSRVPWASTMSPGRRDAPCLARNAAARSVVDHVASRLGTAIATVCAILDTELVVLGGGIGANPLLLPPVRGSAAALVPITARIETSLLGERAALQGAIAVALHAARTMLLSPGAAPRPSRNLVGAPPRGRS